MKQHSVDGYDGKYQVMMVEMRIGVNPISSASVLPLHSPSAQLYIILDKSPLFFLDPPDPP